MYNKESKGVKIIESNPYNYYKTKKNFTGFYTEVNLPAYLDEGREEGLPIAGD